MTNIILVGFMGTGKSSVGKILAERLQMQFMDLDAQIEKDQHLSIPQIFAQKGEPYFRSIEKKIVHTLPLMKNTVVACGGGAVLLEENWDAMKKAGPVICLTARDEIIFQRICQQTHRPLLHVPDPLSRIRELLMQRAPFYAKADYMVDTSDLTIEETVEEIIQFLE